MSTRIAATDLEAYLDEGLPPDEMARIETALRENKGLLAQLAAINGRRDAGLHTLGEIWRRHRIGCPTREQLGSLLLGVLSDEQAEYLRCHIEIVGCRLCRSNLDDLARAQQTTDATTKRRRRYFESSAGLLRKS